MLSIALGQNRSVCMFVISMVKFVARQRCLCNLHVRCASQQAPPSFRGRNTSISASPIPIGPAVRTLFAKKAKNEDCANSACAKCHRSIHNRHHHLPEVETHRSVPLPIAIGLAVRTLFAKKLKIKIVPIAIGMCQVPPIACQLAQSYSRCRSTSIIVSPNPIGPAVQTVFAKRLKIKCANRHVPSATNRFSMGTVIFPRSNHIDQCLSHSDRTSRSDVIREKAKN